MDRAELCKLARGMMEQGQTQAELISSYSAAIAFLHLNHGNPRNERFSVIFLNRKNALVDFRIMGEGTIDHVPVYVREVIRQALLCDASAMILCHNHPSGDPAPSDADIKMTKDIVKAAGLFNITVHDHYILGNGREYSMRGNGDM